jgi:hypothetical protein
LSEQIFRIFGRLCALAVTGAPSANTGRTIRLGPRDTIVLSYLHSCVRETIIGGTVTIGVDQSEVRAGKLTRTKLDCGESMFVPTGNSDAQFAGRVFRGTKPHTP